MSISRTIVHYIWLCHKRVAGGHKAAAGAFIPSPIFTLALTKITMNERKYQDELSGMIAQVEQVHFELMEMRRADEQAVTQVRKERYLAYQKAYYASKIKNDAVKMRNRREKGRARRRSKSTKPKKVPLQGVSQEKEVEVEAAVEVGVARFRLL